MKTEKKETPLRKAVNHLKYIGKIRKDEDLSGIFKLAKNTISTYLNGKPGKKFLKDFESHFNIKVSTFEHSSNSSNTTDSLAARYHVKVEDFQLADEGVRAISVYDLEDSEEKFALIKKFERMNEALMKLTELIAEKEQIIGEQKAKISIFEKIYGIPDPDTLYKQLKELHGDKFVNKGS